MFFKILFASLAFSGSAFAAHSMSCEVTKKVLAYQAGCVRANGDGDCAEYGPVLVAVDATTNVKKTEELKDDGTVVSAAGGDFSFIVSTAQKRADGNNGIAMSLNYKTLKASSTLWNKSFVMTESDRAVLWLPLESGSPPKEGDTTGFRLTCLILAASTY